MFSERPAKQVSRIQCAVPTQTISDTNNTGLHGLMTKSSFSFHQLPSPNVKEVSK